MKIADIQKRLQAPFSLSLLKGSRSMFKRGDSGKYIVTVSLSKKAIITKLDNICPNDWEVKYDILNTNLGCYLKCSLTILGVTREALSYDITNLEVEDLALIKAASLFGIGSYLEDLPLIYLSESEISSEDNYLVDLTGKLPEWALPDHEKSPGGSHLVQALEQLKYELPSDINLQREVYRHLKNALGACSSLMSAPNE